MTATILPGRFREIWLVDFEFVAQEGERPAPVCAVSKEFKTGRTLRLWQDELKRLHRAPFSTGADALFVAYYASAELGCFLSLGWPLPTHVLDLYVEFRALFNGYTTPSGNSLLGAMVAFGLDPMAAQEKEEMRALIMNGGPWSDLDRQAILEYCERDVMALEELFPTMLPHILDSPSQAGRTLSRALLRGRYMGAVARIEHCGTPIDTDTLRALKQHWEPAKRGIIDRIDTHYGVYENGHFRRERFERYLARKGIPWLRNDSGGLALDDDTFRMMAKAYPEISPLREARHLLSELRLNDLAVGADGRNRCLLSPFRARTSRNQPSNSRFIFGPAVWLRGLIRPTPGHGVAYIDYKSQELAIAAALSGDEQMMDAYREGDPYLAFAIQAGLAAKGATKQSDKATRDRCKALVLGLQYGMTESGLARRLGVSIAEAAHLVRLHRQTYRRFWQWSDQLVDHGLLGLPLRTVLGWPLHIGTTPNARSLRNFPMQGNGAEILRLACCLGTEAGICICAPVHDAILIEAPIEELVERVGEMRGLMEKASALVLSGFKIITSAECVCFPHRYMDEQRGRVMWDQVMNLLSELRHGASA